VKSRQIEVFLTPIFTHETLDQYGSGRAGDDWREHLKFAIEICNSGVFLDKSEIFRNELVSGKGLRPASFFQSAARDATVATPEPMCLIDCS
jgi:hypothetical protein